jgi:transcriptional regulator with XRE-family HTH domain
MTGKELAEALGITPSAVSQLAKRGMPTDSVDRANRWRRKHLQRGRMKGVRRDTLPASPLVSDAGQVQDLTDTDPELFDGLDDDEQEIEVFKRSRDRREHYQAELARLALEKETGKLMQSEQVLWMMREAGATLRTSLEQVGARLAPVLAQMTDERTVRLAIDREVESLLSELSRRFAQMAGQSEVDES